jgi:4-hydroxy-3-methylbut-2-enyl diphosphate reductase
VVLVVGSKTSSNSNRLRELAQQAGTPAHLIDGAADIDPAWFDECSRVGVTAGASAPEILVQQVIERLKLECDAALEEREPTVVENMIFPIPAALR